MIRDRYGEPVDDELEDAREHEVVPAPRAPAHRCDDGWLDRDADQPRPCLLCRPWLAERRPPHRDELPLEATTDVRD